MQSGVTGAERLNFFTGVNYGRVMLTSEGATNFGIAVLSQFLAEIHSDLARKSYLSRIALGDQLLNRQLIVRRHYPLDLFDRDNSRLFLAGDVSNCILGELL